MFTADQSPDRVRATPAATAHLDDLAADGHDVLVLLSEYAAEVLPSGSVLPEQRVFLGEVAGVSCMADASSDIEWWRSRALIDLTGDQVTYELSELTEAEVFAALASGPLPRY